MTTPAPPFDQISVSRARRRKADRRFRFYGIVAITAAIALLGLMLGTLILKAGPALTQTMIKVDFPVRGDLVDPSDPANGNYRKITQQAIARLFPEEASPGERRAMTAILTGNTQFILRDAVMANPGVIGGDLTLRIPASDPFDQLSKGFVDQASPEESRRVSDAQIRWFHRLVAEKRVTHPINLGLLLDSDSRFPETSGLAGAFSGTLYMLLVCFLLSFPTGIAAGIYLEEFTASGWFSAVIEVNTNNLAAVPSILFGLLGLAVLIQTFGLPASTPLVGGMVLSLMTLPRVIIVTRDALKSVSPAVRDAAHGIGASRHQVVLHHVLPLALPAIISGAVLALTRALGETAPLLLIGMDAFIPSPSGGLTGATTTLPTQIFAWAGRPEAGFLSRTSAAILILLCFLTFINLIAVILRRRLEIPR